jgi:hypothetical protein
MISDHRQPTCHRTSVADPRNFGTDPDADPDPRINTPDFFMDSDPDPVIS